MAGGSKIIINDQGITITTKGKVLYQAGQHKFEDGARIKAEIPLLPTSQKANLFSNKWDFYDLFYESDFANVKYKLINNKNNTYISGTLDQHGRTQRLNMENHENYDILIGTDNEWSVSIDDGSKDDEFTYSCSAHHHKYKEEN